MSGYDGTDPVSLTQAEFDARDKISEAVEHVRAHLPGFENSYVVDVAEQMGVRQTRLLQGEYVVTKDDVASRRHFADSVARGRDYYTPYRALLPRERRPAAGRRPALLGHPGRAADLPRDPAVHGAGTGRRHRRRRSPSHKGIPVREVDPVDIQRRMRDQGADPGDVPSANATIDAPTRRSGDDRTTAARRSAASPSSTSPRSTWARAAPSCSATTAPR